MHIDLTERVILVTGAARGIGEAIARHLMRSGATVALHCNRHTGPWENLDASTAHNSHVFRADLSDRKASAGLIRQVLDHYGRLDVLINNAGTAIHSNPEKDSNDWLTDWDKTLEVNLTAPALMIHEMLPHFIKQDNGIIINISSRAAFRGDTREYLAYAASKGGMESLTKSLARAYGKSNIIVYGIAPGFTRTDMADAFIARYGEEYALNDIALNQLTTPDDIAPLIVFLASGQARHATGATFDINAASYVR